MSMAHPKSGDSDYKKLVNAWYGKDKLKLRVNWSTYGEYNTADARIAVIRSYSPTYRAIKEAELRLATEIADDTLAKRFFGPLYQKWLDD